MSDSLIFDPGSLRGLEARFPRCPVCPSSLYGAYRKIGDGKYSLGLRGPRTLELALEKPE